MRPRPDDLVHRVAARIAACRREVGLTQETLATRLDIAAKNVQRIESGHQNLSLSTVERIAAALGVAPESFFVAPDRSASSSSFGVLARLASAGYPIRLATDRGRRSSRAVPVTTLRAAAGAIGGAGRVVETLGWVELDRASPALEGQFVAEVVGRSMEPLIPDRAICLFGPAAAGPVAGRVVLVSHPRIADPEMGGPFAVKRVGEPSRLRSGRTRITLRSVNRAFAPIVLDLDDPDELRVVAEFVRVLSPASAGPPRPAPTGRGGSTDRQR